MTFVFLLSFNLLFLVQLNQAIPKKNLLLTGLKNKEINFLLQNFNQQLIHLTIKLYNQIINVVYNTVRKSIITNIYHLLLFILFLNSNSNEMFFSGVFRESCTFSTFEVLMYICEEYACGVCIVITIRVFARGPYSALFCFHFWCAGHEFSIKQWINQAIFQ